MNVKVHLPTSRRAEHRHEEGPQPTLWHRLSVNITLTERIGRIAIGLAAVVVGAILLTSVGSALAVILEVLLIAAGLDLVVTGALGHCPLYAKLGHVPKSPQRTP
jgi:Inner membrane protein YgaP-like, transmembrane domain